MTTRDQLIVHLQDRYAFLRDFLPLLDSMRYRAGNRRLKNELHLQQNCLRTEIETLERALSLLGAAYTLALNPVALAWKEADERFRHVHSPSQEQLDIFTAAKMLMVNQMTISAYQGMVEMACAIGEQDVAKVLEESNQRLHVVHHALQQLLPTLVVEISHTERRAA